ncbi:MAG: DUF2834 domain-containing protein [Chitinophagaceae bacterium]|nr:DUF2834 domain-containing protein [Rubrivivax sp.]
MPRLPLVITLLAFSVLTALALWHHGYWGIFEPHFKTFGAAQVLMDLVIALVLFMVWMWRDARARGRNPWPWLVLTLAAGSFGPLLYLLLGQRVDHAGVELPPSRR